MTVLRPPPIGRPVSGVGRLFALHFQTTALKLMVCFHPNFVRSISAQGGTTILKNILDRVIPIVAMATSYQNFNIFS